MGYADECKHANDLLTKAWEGNFKAAWYLWLASDNYSDAPKQEGKQIPPATEPPLQNLPTGWSGKTIKECVKWVQQMPDDVALNKNYFAVINDDMKGDDSVLVVRIIEDWYDWEDKRGTLEYFPVSKDEVAIVLLTSGGNKFEETLLNYRRTQMREGKPMKCKGGPYPDEYPDDQKDQV